jgi:HD-GYP domain-containing protein (c-di-GMP phosphodiesterase class II)
MDPNKSLDIETKRIKVGMTFDFDLTDSLGRVVLRAGQSFDENVRRKLLSSGVETLTILVMPQGQSMTQVLLDSYSPETVERLQNMLNVTEEAFDAFVEELTGNRRGDCDDLQSHLDRFVYEATRDSSALLGVLAARWNVDLQKETYRMGARVTRLSCLSMVTGTVMGLTTTDVKSIGLAGLMHDIAIFFHPEWQDPEYRTSRRREFLAAYQKHPIESVEYLNMTAGLNQQVLILVSQVHEHVDGSGFPRGLRGAQTLPGGRILNAVDAYLEIVDPMFRNNGIVPADALAQICHHAIQGVFDREAVQCLIEAISVYPIGTEVDLDDSRRAVVIRTNEGKPLEPVVRLLDGSHEVADLLHTKLSIRSPGIGGVGGRRLRPQTEMETPWWDACTTGEPSE